MTEVSVSRYGGGFAIKVSHHTMQKSSTELYNFEVTTSCVTAYDALRGRTICRIPHNGYNYVKSNACRQTMAAVNAALRAVKIDVDAISDDDMDLIKSIIHKLYY